MHSIFLLYLDSYMVPLKKVKSPSQPTFWKSAPPPPESWHVLRLPFRSFKIYLTADHPVGKNWISTMKTIMITRELRKFFESTLQKRCQTWEGKYWKPRYSIFPDFPDFFPWLFSDIPDFQDCWETWNSISTVISLP